MKGLGLVLLLGFAAAVLQFDSSAPAGPVIASITGTGDDHHIDCDAADRNTTADCDLRQSGGIVVAGIDAGGDK